MSTALCLLRFLALNGSLLSVCFMASSSQLSGGFIVAPNSAANVEGNSNNLFPFGTVAMALPSLRYQQVYASSEFSSFTGPQVITGVRFRPDVSSQPILSLLNDAQINLSTTSAQPDNLSAVFANNVGIDDTIVRSGSITLESAFTGPIGGPKDFDIAIDFTIPFVYDPSAGSLLLDIRIFDGANIRVLDAVNTFGDGTSRVHTFVGQTVNSPSGSVVDSFGLVTQFAFTPVPEPSALSLVALSAAIVYGRRRPSVS